MRKNKEIFSCLLCLLLLEYALSEGTCERGKCLGELRFGDILPRSAFRTRFQVSLHQCATECWLRKQRCKSFNYRRIYLSCQLCEEDSGPGGMNLQPKDGSIHSNINTWENIGVGHCNEITCSWTQMCDPSNLDLKSACVPSDCPLLELRPGVTIDPSNETSVGTHVRQRCDLRSMERGNRITTCLERTAEWSTTDFKCVCSTPPAIPGTTNETVEVEVGQTYTYRCLGDLFGKRHQDPTVTCQRDGHWTATHFTCVCETPPVIPGALNETVEVEIGQNYTYRCQDGLFGKRDQIPTITCRQDGHWTETSFTCVCKSPPVKLGAIPEITEVAVGQNYTYKCQNGLFEKGDLNPTITCLQNVCETPPVIPGALNETVEVEIGQNYTYRCQDGLFGKRDQIPTITCRQDGHWTETSFTCVCKSPPVKLGAIPEITEVAVGQNYTYKCQNGLFEKGDLNPTITCLQDGSWTLTHFICVCETPPVIPGALNETVEVEIGQNYTYRCQDGLFGKRDQIPTITCRQDGHWTETSFTCVCKSPPVKLGVIPEITEVAVGQNYTYKCQNGLFEKGDLNPTITCLQDGSWTLTHFICVCETPPVIPGAPNETVEVEIGQNYTYRCQDGLFGKRDQIPTITCRQDGHWTETSFTCACKSPPVKSGAILEITEVAVGQNYTYKCQNGLFEKGNLNPTITCLQDGSWTLTHFICVKQNWKEDTISPRNIQKSEVISIETAIDLLACMQQCDDKMDNCLSFFYDNNTSKCVLSSSFRRGLPQDLQLSNGLVYFTAPSTWCDTEYRNVSLGGSYFCIKFHGIYQTFNEAMKTCESEKAKLIVVTTKAQIDDLRFFVPSIYDATLIGISDTINEGIWLSWEGEEVSPFWLPGEPNNSNDEDCTTVYLSLSGTNDMSCYSYNTFTCNKRVL